MTLAFGTDTCNSLSNPAAFASLATIRTTRGLTSRAGVMPLNTFNDAVGPIAKSVRELALVLDQVAGADPEDEATADADGHVSGSFTTALDPAALKGARIGVLRGTRSRRLPSETRFARRPRHSTRGGRPSAISSWI